MLRVYKPIVHGFELVVETDDWEDAKRSAIKHEPSVIVTPQVHIPIALDNKRRSAISPQLVRWIEKQERPEL